MLYVLKIALATAAFLALAACNPAEEPVAGGDASGKGDGSSQVEEAAPSSCAGCGTVAAIRPVTAEGDSSGAGAAIGAVVGGLLGNQVGGGSGKDAATAVGAVGGALAGNEIEKRNNAVTYYEVVVNMDNGGERVVNVNSDRGISVGTAVEVVGDDLHLR